LSEHRVNYESTSSEPDLYRLGMVQWQAGSRQVARGKKLNEVMPIAACMVED